MKTYRIYTEDINRDEIVKIVSNQFEGYTLFSGIGYWKTEQENSLVIEIIDFDRDDIQVKIEIIARQIKELNLQESVLLTETETKENFV
jgi:hypothetical protein